MELLEELVDKLDVLVFVLVHGQGITVRFRSLVEVLLVLEESEQEI